MSEESNSNIPKAPINFQGRVPPALASNENFFDPNLSNLSDHSNTNHIIPVDHSLSIADSTAPIISPPYQPHPYGSITPPPIFVNREFPNDDNNDFPIMSIFDHDRTFIDHYRGMAPLDSIFPYYSLASHVGTNIYDIGLSNPNQNLNPSNDIFYPFGLNSDPRFDYYTSHSILDQSLGHDYPIHSFGMNTFYNSNSIHPYTLNPLGSNYSYAFNENPQQLPTFPIISPFYIPNNTPNVIEASGYNLLPSSFNNPHSHGIMNFSFQNQPNTEHVFENDPHGSNNYSYSLEIRLGLRRSQEINNANTSDDLRRSYTRELSDQSTYRCGICGSEYPTFQIMDEESSNQDSRIPNELPAVANLEPTTDDDGSMSGDT